MTKTIWWMTERATGTVVSEFDVTDMSDRERQRMFDGMVYQVDFEKFYLDRGAPTA